MRLSDLFWRKRCRYDEHPKPRPENNCMKIFKLHSLFPFLCVCSCGWVGSYAVHGKIMYIWEKSLPVMEHALYGEKYKGKECVGGYTTSGQ